MSDKAQTPTVNRYDSIRVPIFKTAEYPTWKVKMAMFLKATDPEYLDRIYDGPDEPTKILLQLEKSNRE